MKTIQEIRRENARKLAKQAGSDAAFADRVGMSPSRISQLIGANPIKNIGHSAARRIEAEFGKKTGWLDMQHESEGEENGRLTENRATSRHPIEKKPSVELADELSDVIHGYIEGDDTDRSIMLAAARVVLERQRRRSKNAASD